MADNKSGQLFEKLVLFIVFLIFAGIIVSFAYNWNYVEDDNDSTSSFQFITVSKTENTEQSKVASSIIATGKININTASLEELDTLPGIGPKKAQDIIKYRDTVSPFVTIEDITKVSGIGEKTFEKLKDYIVVK